MPHFASHVLSAALLAVVFPAAAAAAVCATCSGPEQTGTDWLRHESARAPQAHLVPIEELVVVRLGNLERKRERESEK